MLKFGVAALVVISYNYSRKSGSIGDSRLFTVIVSTEEIPRGQLLDPLIEKGVFVEIRIPPYAIVEGAVADLPKLRGMRTTTTILANEQIPTSRLTSDSCPEGVECDRQVGDAVMAT